MNNTVKIRKNVQCPRCMKIVTTSGLPSEVVKVQCISCGFVNKVTFRKPDYIIEAENVHKIYATGKIQVHA